MEIMPQTPDEQARNAATARIAAHLTVGWPRLGPPDVRVRGQYCYVAVTLPGHRGPAPFLCLRWTGSPEEWDIGIYKATIETYSENEFPWSYGPSPARRSRESTRPSNSTQASRPGNGTPLRRYKTAKAE